MELKAVIYILMTISLAFGQEYKFESQIRTRIDPRKVKLYSGPAVEWRNVTSKDVGATLRDLIPAGIDWDNTIQYLCRAYYSNYWIPGKLIFNDTSGLLTCNIPSAELHGREIIFPMRKAVQVLVAAPGALSWIPIRGYGFGEDPVPENAVNGGHHMNGEIAPICRINCGRNCLVVGVYGVADHLCWHLNEKGGVSAVSTIMEILVVNLFGGKIKA